MHEREVETPASQDSPGGADQPDRAAVERGVHAAALASLPRATPKRLDRLLAGRAPSEAWAIVARGAVPSDVADAGVRAAWTAHADRADLTGLAASLEALDARVTTPQHPDHPRRLRDDIDPAPVLFRRGRAPDDRAQAVAIVGTRRCTPTGRSVAMELGAGLAAAGVTVISGLALGIDGAAHRGALNAPGAPVVGVVGSGIDVVYPRGNHDLWQAVVADGTLLSEAPLGAEPEGWRFPARNRLLAALADVVVVVESKRAGGSMHTVEEALRRDVAVMAVPGSVRNPAAEGTNFLLSEGCAPACGLPDVLTALGLASEARRDAASSGNETRGGHSPHELDEVQQRLVAAVDDGPVSLDQLVLRVGRPAPQVLVAADRLEALGLLARDGGRIMRA